MPELKDAPSRELSASIDPATMDDSDLPTAAPAAPAARGERSLDRDGAAAVNANVSARAPVRRFLTRTTLLLGAAGTTGGAALLGVLAYRVAHPLSTVTLIAALGGVAGGAIGVSLPALGRALAWSAIAASALAVGGAALWAIHQVDPLLIRQIVPRW